MSDSETLSGKTNRKTGAIIVAAGTGARSGLDHPKQFEPVAGAPMVRHSAAAMLAHPAIDHLWVVIGAGQQDRIADALAGLSPYTTVIGGETRQQSVFNGLTAVNEQDGIGQILIHDAARPFLSTAMIDRLLEKLVTEDAVIPALPMVDTVVQTEAGYAGVTLDRDTLWRVQTPQAFDFEKLYQAHRSADEDRNASDDAQLMRAAGHHIAVIDGDERLKKYTIAEDFSEKTQDKMPQIRTGMGYDVHQLVAGEKLWLGGLQIVHDKGLAGHSDADVLLHALTDALLGAAGAGDIGDHFPPSDPQWRGAASRQFVEHAALVIKQKGASINNVDMTIICEAPKIKPHREAIRQNIADMLEISLDQVSVKATTTERLGFTGRGEGIAAQAIATISME